LNNRFDFDLIENAAFRRLMRLYVTPVRLPDKQASRSAAPYPRYVRHSIVPPYRLTKMR